MCKKIIFANPDDDNIALEDGIEDPLEDADIAVGKFQDTIEIMRRVTKKIHSSSKIMDALEKVQQDAGRLPLKIICENSTRWNSVYDSMKRFLQLKPSLCLLLSEELVEFDWDKLERTCKL